mgnify:CR=1 FL=1
MKKKSLLVLILMTSSLFSCSNKSGIHQGQSTRAAFEQIQERNVSYIRMKDFTLFEYENRNYVVQQSQDYTYIKKVKDYVPVVPSLSDFDRLKSGMDLFQVVKMFGMPYSYDNENLFILAFMTQERRTKLVMFQTNLNQIYRTC